MKVNLGSGRKSKKGFINVDSWIESSADVKEDCLLFLKKQADNSIDELYTRHFFEHLDSENLLKYINEINRVMANGSNITVIVPHWSNPAYYSDPTHKSFYGLYTFEYFCKYSRLALPRNIPRYAVSSRLTLVEVEFRFIDKSIIGKIITDLLNSIVNCNPKLKHFYEERLCRFIPCYEIKYQMTISNG